MAINSYKPFVHTLHIQLHLLPQPVVKAKPSHLSLPLLVTIRSIPYWLVLDKVLKYKILFHLSKTQLIRPEVDSASCKSDRAPLSAAGPPLAPRR